MIKSAGHDYAIDEPLELRSVPVVDSSEYVARILCTGCGRDFDVLRSDKTGYAPVVPAHAHGTAEVGGGTLPGCRSLSVVPFEPEPPRRAAARSAARRSPFQTMCPGRSRHRVGVLSKRMTRPSLLFAENLRSTYSTLRCVMRKFGYIENKTVFLDSCPTYRTKNLAGHIGCRKYR